MQTPATCFPCMNQHSQPHLTVECFLDPADRLRSIELRVGDVEPVNRDAIARNAVCRNVWSPVPPGLQEFRCNTPLQGRYIIIRGLGSAASVSLSVCEVVPVYTPTGR
jgi:hypothetical protein